MFTKTKCLLSNFCNCWILAPGLYTTLFSGGGGGCISLGLPEQIADKNSPQSLNLKLTFWLLNTRHKKWRKIPRSFSSHLSSAHFFLPSLSLWSQEYSCLNLILSLTSICCPERAICPANVLLSLSPPQNTGLILASLKQECAKKPIINHISSFTSPVYHFPKCY